jgi:hypothetical protein
MAAATPSRGRHGVADDLGQLRRRRQGAGGDDGAGDTGGVAFVAQRPQDAGQLALAGLVDQVGGPQGPRGVHPHVERALAPEAEAALGAIELRRAHAQVEQGAAGLGVPEFVEHRRQAVEPGVAQGHPVTETAQALARGGQGVGVLVEADDHQVRVGLEQRLGVAAPAHRGVDDDAGRHGREQLDHDVTQHGLVGERPASAGGCSPAHRRASGRSALAGMSPRVELDERRAESGPSTASAGSLRAGGTARMRARARVTASGPALPGGRPRRARRGSIPGAAPTGRGPRRRGGGGRR